MGINGKTDCTLGVFHFCLSLPLAEMHQSLFSAGLGHFANSWSSRGTKLKRVRILNLLTALQEISSKMFPGF